MKTFKRAMVSALALLVVGSTFPACGGNAGIVDDPTTINVKMFKGGFGVEWVYELKAKFEEVYKDEGYKVNIVAPSSDMRGSVPLSDLAKGYATTKTDLYITGDIQSAQVGKNNSYGEKGVALVEETEQLVYKQKAIGYDGVEEDKTVEEKLDANMLTWLKDAESEDSDNVYYGVPYINPIAGVVVNTRKLAKYGYTETPRTTNEFIQMSTDIYLGNDELPENSYESGTYPFTYFSNSAGGGAGYGSGWINAAIAQYDYETYKQLETFTKYNPETGKRDYMIEDGYEVYNTNATKYCIELMYFLFDPVMAAPGSTTQQMDKSQGQIMKDAKGNAVFMVNGSWMLNEVALTYKNYLQDIDFINYPVLSIIGVEEFGAGTTLNLSEKEADELLSYIVKLVDQNKTIEEIIADVQTNKNKTVSQESVERIAFSRGLNYNRGIEHQCFITKGSEKKDIAALFLRMLASDDCSETIARLANSTSSFANKENADSDKKFVVSASKIPVNRHATPYRWWSVGLRKRMGIGKPFPKDGDLLPQIYTKMNTMYDYENGTMIGGDDYFDLYSAKGKNAFKVYTNKANERWQLEYNNAKDSWATWIERAAL